jgi:hypothetical protein
MKWRNSKERELIAHGGSREQTLPTKHNPNPDLSDAVISSTVVASNVAPYKMTTMHGSQSPNLHSLWPLHEEATSTPPTSHFASAAERMRLVAMQAKADVAAAAAKDVDGDDMTAEDGGSDCNGGSDEEDDDDDDMEEIHVT